MDKYFLNSNINDSFYRNFGGLDESIPLIKSIFKRKCNRYMDQLDYEVMRAIAENLTDMDSRYLMIISKTSSSSYILDTILKKRGLEFTIYIDSQFEKDLQNEDYSYKVLNKI